MRASPPCQNDGSPLRQLSKITVKGRGRVTALARHSMRLAPSMTTMSGAQPSGTRVKSSAGRLDGLWMTLRLARPREAAWALIQAHHSRSSSMVNTCPQRPAHHRLELPPPHSSTVLPASFHRWTSSSAAWVYQGWVSPVTGSARLPPSRISIGASGAGLRTLRRTRNSGVRRCAPSHWGCGRRPVDRDGRWP